MLKAEILDQQVDGENFKYCSQKELYTGNYWWEQTTINLQNVQNNTFNQTRPAMALYTESASAPYRRLLAIDTSGAAAVDQARILYYNTDTNVD